jgi:serine/threonine-protein kinase
VLDEAVSGTRGVVQPGGRDRYRVILPANADRIQEVYVELRRVRPHEKEIAVYSLCGPADPRHYEFALRFNGQYPPGGLSIQEVNGTSMFVMARTLHPSRATATELRQLLSEVARLGDLVEQRVVEFDLF